MADITQLEAEVAKLKKALDTLVGSGAQVSSTQLDILRKTISMKESELKILKAGPTISTPQTPVVQQPQQPQPPVAKQPEQPRAVQNNNLTAPSTPVATQPAKPEATPEVKTEEQKKAEVAEVIDVVVVEITRSKHDEIIKNYKKNYEDIMEPDQLQKMINNALTANSLSADQDKIQRVANGAQIKIIFVEEKTKEQLEAEELQKQAQNAKEEKKKAITSKLDPFKYTKVFLDKTPQGGTEFLDSQVRGEKGMAALAAKSQISYETLVSNPAHNVTTARAISEAPRTTPNVGAGQEISAGRKS